MLRRHALPDGSTGATMHNRSRCSTTARRARRSTRYERAHPEAADLLLHPRGLQRHAGLAALRVRELPRRRDDRLERAPPAWPRRRRTCSTARSAAPTGSRTDIGGYFDVGPYLPTTKELFLRWARVGGAVAVLPPARLGARRHPHAVELRRGDAWRSTSGSSRLHLAAPAADPAGCGAAPTRTGMPITRPLWLAYPATPRPPQQDQEWLLGPDVLVAPVVDAGRRRARRCTSRAGCWQEPGNGPAGSAVRCGGRWTSRSIASPTSSAAGRSRSRRLRRRR